MNKFKWFFIALLVGATSVSLAKNDDDSIAAGGLIPPIQHPDEKETIIGLRISPGYAKHKALFGADFGLIGNVTDDRFIGMAFAGGFNSTDGVTDIIFFQWAGLSNYNKGTARVYGTQLTLGINYAGKSTYIFGFQVGFLGNIGGNKIYGAQLGLYNEAESVYGFQIGVINKTKNLHGMQIGLLNFAEKGGLSVFPVVNVGF